MKSESSVDFKEKINFQEEVHASSTSKIQEIYEGMNSESQDFNEDDLTIVPKVPPQKIPDSIGPYKIKGQIGEGAFSVVKLAYHPLKTSYYACKIIQKQLLYKGDLLPRFESEIRVQQQLHHPSIVEIYDLLSDENFFYVVMEFCQGGELFQYIIDRGRVPEDQSKSFLHQLLESIKYLHQLNICHRDLKPENLLFDQFGILKVSDFGLSRYLNSDGLSFTPCGSPCYASPECLSGHPFDGKKSDIWSCGVIAYAMLTGQLPWTKRNQTQLFNQIKTGDFVIPDYLSPNAKDFISQLMKVNFKERLTAEEALKHPFLQDAVRMNNYSVSSPIISLRCVDKFFEKEYSFFSLKKSNSIKFNNNSTSQKQITFRKTKKLINSKVSLKAIAKLPQPAVSLTYSGSKRKVLYKRMNYQNHAAVVIKNSNHRKGIIKPL